MIPDPCCFLCRTPYGCATPSCDHHAKAQAQQDADHRARRTHRDPTADQAIGNVMRPKNPKPKAATKRPISYPKEDR